MPIVDRHFTSLKEMAEFIIQLMEDRPSINHQPADTSVESKACYGWVLWYVDEEKVEHGWNITVPVKAAKATCPEFLRPYLSHREHLNRLPDGLRLLAIQNLATRERRRARAPTAMERVLRNADEDNPARIVGRPRAYTGGRW